MQSIEGGKRKWAEDLKPSFSLTRIDRIRVTTICPCAIEFELESDIIDPSEQCALKEFRKIAPQPDAIAGAVLFAVSQPDGVDVNKVIVRPTARAF